MEKKEINTSLYQKIKHLIVKYPLESYFLFAFAITWILAVPLIISNREILPFEIPQIWDYIVAMGPISAAFIITGITQGRSGVENLKSRLLRYRVGKIWIILALFSPILLYISVIVLLELLEMPLPTISEVLELPKLRNFSWIVTILLPALMYGIGEETGWRGFALPRLQENRSALSATFILAFWHIIWHIPFFFYKFELDLVGTFGFALGIFIVAIWLTFLYNSTNGSILMVVLWHFSWNIVGIIAPLIAEESLYIITSILICFSLILPIIGSPSKLSTKEKSTEY
jgi:membrane protease YdiL (CAAX protease family)